MEYEHQVAFEVCAVSYRPIYPGSSVVRSPFTQTAYKPEHVPSVCVVSEYEVPGKEASGLILFEH